MPFATTDLCDRYEARLDVGTLRVLDPGFLTFGLAMAFHGAAATLKVFEDNSLVRSALEQAGDGRVLVVDGGGSRRCALVGGNLGVLAASNGWAGILVYGCVRDTDELNACPIGIRALAAHPRKSVKRGIGEYDVTVHLPGTSVHAGDWIYADADGVLVSDIALD